MIKSLLTDGAVQFLRKNDKQIYIVEFKGL